MEENGDSAPSYATVLHWKMVIHEVLAGDKASEIIQAGGAAGGYLKTLFPFSSERTVARHYCVKALNEVIDEISLVSLPSFALNHLLSLIVEFKPEQGFASIASFLQLGGMADNSFLPVGASVPIDLHFKLLNALGSYFKAAAINSQEPAFLTYIEILKQHLDTDYRGYTAFELLKLEVLQPDVPEFKSFLEQYPESLKEIVLNLNMYASGGYGARDITTLLHVALESGKKMFTIMNEAIKEAGGTLEPITEQDPYRPGLMIETPTHLLRLFNGSSVPIYFTQEQVELMYRYEFGDDTQADLSRLFRDSSLDQSLQTDIATNLFASSLMDINRMEIFEREIEEQGGELVHDAENDRVYIQHHSRQISIDLGRIPNHLLALYPGYRKELADIPSEPEEIEATLEELTEKARVAFG